MEIHKAPFPLHGIIAESTPRINEPCDINWFSQKCLVRIRPVFQVGNLKRLYFW